MRVDDGAELMRTLKSRHEVSRDYAAARPGSRGHRRRSPFFRRRSRELSTLSLPKLERAQPMPELDRHVAGTQEPQGRLHEDVSQTVTRNERPAALPPRARVARVTRAGKPQRSPPSARC